MANAELQIVRSDIKKLDQRVGSLDRRVGSLERKVDSQGGILNNLALKAIEHDARFQSIEENMLTRKDGDRIMNRLDSIAEWILVSKDKEPVQDHRLTELETKTAGHETRLIRLESK